MSNKPLKLVITDDNRFFVDALAESLNSHDEFTVAATFTSIPKLIEYTKVNLCDILILDVNFSGTNALDYISEILNNQKFKIICLTTLNNNYIAQQAKEKGVHCFVGKDSELSCFKQTILNCYQEKSCCAPVINSKVTVGNLNFTKRKLEILQALYTHSDKTGKAISELLNISENALKYHKKDLFEITDTKNTTELIKFGIQNGLIIA